MCMCLCACVRTCVESCVFLCACELACVCACVGVYPYTLYRIFIEVNVILGLLKGS